MAAQPGGPPPRVPDELQPSEQGGERPREGSVARMRLLNFLAAAHASDEDAEERYRSALVELRKDARAAVVEIARALGETRIHDFPMRERLVYGAGALEHRSALPLLVSVVETPIPPELNPPEHGLGTTAHEIILRTTAIEAIGTLAKQRDKEAVAVLLRFVESPVFSIRRAAVQAILAAQPGRATRSRLARMLPRDQQFLLELRSVPVSEVPQPDPKRHMRSDARDKSDPPEPAQPGAGGRAESSPRPRRS